MSACEECWTEAQRQVMLLGGSVVDRYRAQLKAHDEPASSQALLPQRVGLTYQPSGLDEFTTTTEGAP